MICDNLPVDIVFRFAPLQEAECFGQVIIEDDSFMPELANQKILLFHLSLER